MLVSTAIAECEAAHVTELYAGAGNFTLPLARQGAQVDAVEASRELVRFGETRARESGLGDRITFFRESCEKFCKTREFRECVLLDPPRSGAPAVVEKLLQSPQVKRLVYVSCYLPTLCRDMKALAEVGFKLERTYVIDMFAQTHHVETISVMVRE